MNATSAVVTSSTGESSARAFWENLWRSSRIQFFVFFIIVYAIYPNQPQVSASPKGGNLMQLLIAVIFSNFSVLPGFAAQMMYPTASSQECRYADRYQGAIDNRIPGEYRPGKS